MKYEIAEDRELPENGQLFLLKASKAEYKDINRGDRLRANSEVNFRQDVPVPPDSSKLPPSMFVLQKDDCVIVTSTPKQKRVFQTRKFLKIT